MPGRKVTHDYSKKIATGSSLWLTREIRLRRSCPRSRRGALMHYCPVSRRVEFKRTGLFPTFYRDDVVGSAGDYELKNRSHSGVAAELTDGLVKRVTYEQGQLRLGNFSRRCDPVFTGIVVGNHHLSVGLEGSKGDAGDIPCPAGAVGMREIGCEAGGQGGRNAVFRLSLQVAKACGQQGGQNNGLFHDRYVFMWPLMRGPAPGNAPAFRHSASQSSVKMAYLRNTLLALGYLRGFLSLSAYWEWPGRTS